MFKETHFHQMYHPKNHNSKETKQGLNDYRNFKVPNDFGVDSAISSSNPTVTGIIMKILKTIG